MPDFVDRRTVLASAGALAGLGIGTIGLRAHETRSYLDPRIRCRNESTVGVDLQVRLFDDDTEYRAEQYLSGTSDGTATTSHLPGPWIKDRGPYSIGASIGTASLTLDNDAIVDAVDGGGPGPTPIRVTLIVDGNAALDATIERRD